MPIVEGLSFSYVLHELPRERWPFRRWRFELWHGSRLEAAGWRLSERDAARALSVHGSRVGHAMFGLKPPVADAGATPAVRAGAAAHVKHGAIAFALVPRALETPGVGALRT